MKKFFSNIKFYAVAVICFYLAWITGTGEILNYVPFADPLNEMAFFGLTTVFGAGSLFCAWSE